MVAEVLRMRMDPMSIHATNEDNIEHAHDMIQLDRRVTTDEMTNCLQINNGYAYEIIHNRNIKKWLQKFYY
jgi:hypothetical protein